MASATAAGRVHTTVKSALRLAANRTLDRVDELSLSIADLLHSKIAELPDDPQTRLETRRSNRALILAFAGAMRRGQEVRDLPVPVETIESVRAMARVGTSLQPVLRLSHLGLGAFLDAWDQQLRSLDLDEASLVETRRLSQRQCFEYADNLIQTATATYEAERHRWVNGIEGRRAEAVRELITGAPPDTDAVSRAIGYELQRVHLALVLWTVADIAEGTMYERLKKAATEVVELLSHERPLTVSAAGGQVWAWVGLAGDPPLPGLEGLAGTVRADGVSVAIGEPGSGPAGFRRSHRDAAEAARVAMLSGAPPGTVTLARRVRLAALLAKDIDRARTFVQRQLGELAIADDEQSRLREALRVFLEQSGHRPAAAARLNIHPNTVSNRVAAAQAVLGRELSEQRLELHVALTLAEVLGPAVLTSASKV